VRIEAIVVAAGAGTRMGSPVKKPYILLQNVPLLIHTLRALRRCERISRYVVVVAQEDLAEAEAMIRNDGFGSLQVVPGGAERQDSVRCGLQAVSQETDVVLVHDAARPFVSPQEIDHVIEAAWEIGAATLGTPVKDTIKEVQESTVVRTLKRDRLVAVQTPQAFRVPLLREAHQRALAEGVMGTDDASLLEWMGHPVMVVPGSYRNLKITTPEDLWIAEMFLQKERMGGGSDVSDRNRI
jgi:2-C-methyl-D-erythritol 4-phosphate cytidylyltransferase